MTKESEKKIYICKCGSELIGVAILCIFNVSLSQSDKLDPVLAASTFLEKYLWNTAESIGKRSYPDKRIENN